MAFSLNRGTSSRLTEGRISSPSMPSNVKFSSNVCMKESESELNSGEETQLTLLTRSSIAAHIDRHLRSMWSVRFLCASESSSLGLWKRDRRGGLTVAGVSPKFVSASASG
jgi:hypothetical protein